MTAPSSRPIGCAAPRPARSAADRDVDPALFLSRSGELLARLTEDCLRLQEALAGPSQGKGQDPGDVERAAVMRLQDLDRITQILADLAAAHRAAGGELAGAAGGIGAATRAAPKLGATRRALFAEGAEPADHADPGECLFL